MNFKSIYFSVYYGIVIILFMLVITGCSTQHKFDSFKAQSCIYVYCESSEYNKAKKAGLKLVEIAASIYNIDLELNRGICEEYYTKRELDYRYAAKSASEVCSEL